MQLTDSGLAGIDPPVHLHSEHMNPPSHCSGSAATPFPHSVERSVSYASELTLASFPLTGTAQRICRVLNEIALALAIRLAMLSSIALLAIIDNTISAPCQLVPLCECPVLIGLNDILTRAVDRFWVRSVRSRTARAVITERAAVTLLARVEEPISAR